MMQQLVAQIVVFTVIGAAVYGLSRLLRCRPSGACLPDPRRSTWHALVAVAVSMVLIGLLILRQVWMHGTGDKSGPRVRSFGDLLPQLVVLVIYGVPAAFFLIRDKEPLRSVGITTTNLWQATLIGLALAGLPLTFGSEGPAGVWRNLQPHHAIAAVYYAFVGFGEEFLFRGYLQNRAVAWLGAWRGWLLASVVMALVHFPHRCLIEGLSVPGALAAAGGLIPVSLLMGFVMLRTGNIVAPGLFHTFANWATHVHQG